MINWSKEELSFIEAHEHELENWPAIIGVQAPGMDYAHHRRVIIMACWLANKFKDFELGYYLYGESSAMTQIYYHPEDSYSYNSILEGPRVKLNTIQNPKLLAKKVSLSIQKQVQIPAEYTDPMAEVLVKHLHRH